MWAFFVSAIRTIALTIIPSSGSHQRSPHALSNHRRAVWVPAVLMLDDGGDYAQQNAAIPNVDALAQQHTSLGRHRLAVADQQRLDQYQPDTRASEAREVGQVSGRHHDQTVPRVGQFKVTNQPPFRAAQLFGGQRRDEVRHGHFPLGEKPLSGGLGCWDLYQSSPAYRRKAQVKCGMADTLKTTNR